MVLELESRKWALPELREEFLAAFPGLLPQLRATEPFRRSVCQKHFDGISRSRLGQRERISGATVERWLGDYLRRLAAERASPLCPRILGIDEHFCTRRLGYATTVCDLKNHTVYDVVPGRSELSEGYLSRLEEKHLVKAVLYGSGRRLPSDRPHTLSSGPHRGGPLSRHPTVNHHFLTCWRDLDLGSKKPGADFTDAPPPPQPDR